MVASGIAALFLAGCGQVQGAPPLTWPRALPPFGAIRRLALTPSWSQAISWPSSLSVSPDGSAVAGDGTAGPWGYQADGAAIALTSASGGAVFAVDEGMVAVGPGPSDRPGTVALFGTQGLVWSEHAVGPVSVVSSPSRVVVLDEGSGRGSLLDVGPAGVTQRTDPSLRALPPGGGVLLDNAGDLLLYSDQRVEWIPALSGAARWTVKTGTAAPARQLAVSPNGSTVTAATGQGDNTLYQFGLQGTAPSLLWTEPLAPGGADLLSVASNGNIGVWDVGGGPTLAVYRAGDGAMLWQDTVTGGPGASPALLGMAFGPNGSVVAAVDDCQDDSPCLLFLAANGAPLGYAPLPAGTRVALSQDGTALVGGSAPGGSGGASLSWWNLGEVWQGLLSAPATAPSTTSQSAPSGKAGSVAVSSATTTSAGIAGRAFAAAGQP